MDAKPAGALKGLRVLDLTQIIGGPYATMMMGDMGADVIKIEEPMSAEARRTSIGPTVTVNGKPVAFNAYWMFLNRNKRAITLNLQHPRGRELLLKLVSNADIIVENMRGGVPEKLRLTYDDFAAAKPDIIHASISAFGRTGPDKDLPGYDLLAQARSGFMSLTGPRDGPPMKGGSSLADYLAGLHTTVAVLAALRHRDATGEGQFIDIALLDCMFSALDGFPEWKMMADITVRRNGTQHATNLPAYQTFETRDGGWVAIGAPPGPPWERLAVVIGRPDLIETDEQRTTAWQRSHHEIVRGAVSDWMLSHTRADILETLTQANVASAPVQGIDEAVADPQLAAREMIIDSEYPTLGKIRTVGSAIKMSRTPTKMFRRPPLVGEHNFEVLQSLADMSDDDMVELLNDGVI
jgi:formyl-CoA transferase